MKKFYDPWDRIKRVILLSYLTRKIPCFENIVDPDQLVSSGSTLFLQAACESIGLNGLIHLNWLVKRKI